MSNEETPHKKRSSHVEDAEEIREVFGALNEAIPKLISGLIGSLYSPESAGNVATAIGRFYTKLIEEGIPKEVALKMTENYVSALDFKKIMSIASDGAKGGGDIRIEIDEDEEE
ncbi:hypothetical protein EU538_06625 [Candidatus Thorarchaeota archaeon]|nr:MAG: hypothetical protein EU538_06625 [Candidatus Thorarchaeota archaeon]